MAINIDIHPCLTPYYCTGPYNLGKSDLARNLQFLSGSRPALLCYSVISEKGIFLSRRHLNILIRTLLGISSNMVGILSEYLELYKVSHFKHLDR